ncbi:MAG TPA: FtsX-like permease family protein [Aggregatilineales bacterium]|nr:FtsX-like permease family protein [Aggregatilineales bacterium]
MKTHYELIGRNLNASRSRTILSVLAVTLGVAATIAVNIVGQSVRRGMLKTDEIRAMAQGLLDEFDPFLSFIGIVILFAAGFLIYNAFVISVKQRHQQIGALRILGMTRGQIWRLLIGEALLIAVVGTVAGGLSGPLLGKALLGVMNSLIGELFVFEEASAEPVSVLLALGLGIGVTLLAMLFPARRAMQVSPLAALYGPEVHDADLRVPRRTWLGLAMIGLLLGYLVVDPPGRWVTPPLDGLLTVLFLGVWLLALILILPGLIGFVGSRTRSLLARTFRATGRLVADNLQRERSRVSITIFTIVVAIMVLTALTGFIDFFANDLFKPTLQNIYERQLLYISRFDPAAGWAKVLAQKQATLMLSDADVATISDVAGTRAVVAPMYMVVVPELSSMGNSFFSDVIDPEILGRLGSTFFTFSEGSWETAMPILRSGCGVLIVPGVAAKNNVRLGDTFKVSGPGGPVTCTVAGIGRSPAGISMISQAAGVDFGIKSPFFVFILPDIHTDPLQLQEDLRTRLPNLTVNNFKIFGGAFDQAFALLTVAMNVMLLLALLAAAMGVINTTMVSVIERRREIGLLRAVGATKRQIRAVILGEAAMIGLLGGLIGVLAGVGATVISVVTYGGSAWDTSLALWSAALQSARSALLVGLIGIVAMPLISAVVAWIPARSILSHNPIETLVLE